MVYHNIIFDQCPDIVENLSSEFLISERRVNAAVVGVLLTSGNNMIHPKQFVIFYYHVKFLNSTKVTRVFFQHENLRSHGPFALRSLTL